MRHAVSRARCDRPVDAAVRWLLPLAARVVRDSGGPLTGKPLARRAVLKRFKQNLARARVREVRFHDLRHTFGTRMAAAGVPLRTLQEWMGHRDFKTTLIYADYQPSEQEAALVERAFGRQLQHEASGA